MAKHKISTELKKQIYKHLKYTSQDYENIMRDMIELFTNEELAGLEWDNLSEADPMFILLHLVAAHKDILNYMIDYRVLETYALTARERASLIRIAKSAGYKIPGYLPASARYKVTEVSEENVELPEFTQFIAKDGTSWTNVEVQSNLSVDNEFILVQGIPNNLTFKASDIDSQNATMLIPGGNVPTQQQNLFPISKLIEKDAAGEWKEVSNLIGYAIGDSITEDNPYKPYMVDKDTKGMHYIQFPKDMSSYIAQISKDQIFSFNYLSTEGSKVTRAPETLMVDLPDEKYIVLNLIDGTLTKGKDEATADEVREGLLNYRGNLQSLSTLEDYKQFVLNKQIIIPNVKHVLVIDKQMSTNDLINGEPSLKLGEVAIYLVAEDNNGNIITNLDTSDLLEEINRHKQAGIQITINETDTDTNEIEERAISVTYTKTNNSVTDSRIEELLKERLEDKCFGDVITEAELNLLIANKLNKNVNVTINPDNTINLQYYEYLTSTIDGV